MYASWSRRLEALASQDLPELSGRDDHERADRLDPLQRRIPGDEQLGATGEGLAEERGIGMVGICSGRFGVVDDLDGLARDELDDRGQLRRRKLHLLAKRRVELTEQVAPDVELVLEQDELHHLGAHSPCRKRAHQHVGVEKDPHETARKTSPPATSPYASANGRLFFRSSRNRATATWRRRASRAISLFVRPGRRDEEAWVGWASRDSPLRGFGRTGSDWCPELQIAGAQSRVLGNAREHLGADFLTVVKREDEVLPPLTAQGPMRPRLAIDAPPLLNKGSKDTTSLNRRPLAHAATTEIVME